MADVTEKRAWKWAGRLDTVLSLWSSVPRGVRWLLAAAVQLAVGVWGYTAPLTLQAKVALALLLPATLLWVGLGIAFWRYLRHQMIAEARARPAVWTAQDRENIKRIVGVLTGYRDGFNRLATAIEAVQRESELKPLQQRYSSLSTPVIHYLSAQSRFVGSMAYRLFAHDHPTEPSEPLKSNLASKRRLWAHCKGCEAHLNDFLRQLNVHLSDAP
jgi:hypothetical protein